jgi:dihydroorotase
VTGHLIRGGTVLRTSGPVTADVLVRDRAIVEVGAAIEAVDIATIDATGCWVGPGFVDIHTHLREPGQEHKEDIASGSAAAAAGGYTAVVAMPNTEPAIDSGIVARLVADRGRKAGLVEVVPSGTVTKGRKGVELAPLAELWAAGVRLFTDDGDTVADAGLLRQAMEFLASRNGVISQHAVDPGLAAGGCMNEGAISSQLGLRGVPARAEEIIIERDIGLVRLTGARYHVQHISTAGGVALVAAAKAEGLPVTAEVTPHHLSFTDTEVLSRDPIYKMMPPLRTDADVAALRKALISGIVDVVATDHAPHAAGEKAVPFEDAPPGVTGLEWAAAAVLTATSLDIERFFDRMAAAPAQIAGLADRHGLPVEPGNPANLVVFDPERTLLAEGTLSRSSNSPYLGRSWRGVVRHTMYRGVMTHTTGVTSS